MLTVSVMNTMLAYLLDVVTSPKERLLCCEEVCNYQQAARLEDGG